MIRKLGYVLIAAAGLMLGGCAATVGIHNNPAASFQVKVWVDRNASLKTGDEAIVFVSADRACHLHVYYLAGSGAVRQIFPDNSRADARIDGNTQYRIPPAGAGYRLVLRPPPAQETVMAVATLGPVRLLPAERVDDSGVIPVVKMTHREFQRTVKANLNRLDPETWSADTTYFTYAP